jgi:hypothetical protein
LSYRRQQPQTTEQGWQEWREQSFDACVKPPGSGQQLRSELTACRWPTQPGRSEKHYPSFGPGRGASSGGSGIPIRPPALFAGSVCRSVGSLTIVQRPFSARVIHDRQSLPELVVESAGCIDCSACVICNRTQRFAVIDRFEMSVASQPRLPSMIPMAIRPRPRDAAGPPLVGVAPASTQLALRVNQSYTMPFMNVLFVRPTAAPPLI